MGGHTQRSRQSARGIRSWIAPVGMLLIAGLLIVLVILQMRPDAASDAGEPATDGITVVPDGLPDLTQFEYRDADDVQAAGPVDAPVGLVVYSDYQCPFCAKWAQSTLPRMMEYADAGDLRIEWRDINMYGAPSERASLAAHAAGLQGEYWAFHDALYPDGEIRTEAELSIEALTGLAEQMELDVDRFSSDMASEEVKQIVAERAHEARTIGVTGTPSFLLDGRPIVGAQPTDIFIDAVENALIEADR
ncbi:thioredoxin domain-containing protein [Microbacterium esteraromaticum]|uniref:DsbA family protein n=1 Tax=Microbacterium esteraromaticum TaxID=57043 RepID=UPI0015CC7C0B